MGSEQGTHIRVSARRLSPGCVGSVLGRAPGSCSSVLHLPRALQNSPCSVPRDACGSFTPLRLFFLETPAPESSGYVKMCLHLKQKGVSQPCDPRGKFVTTCGLGCLEWPSLLGSTCSSKGPCASGSLEPAHI